MRPSKLPGGLTGFYQEEILYVNDSGGVSSAQSDGTNAPGVMYQLQGPTAGDAYVNYRNFDENDVGGQWDQLIFAWPVPSDCDVAAGITFKVHCGVSSGTPPASSEKVRFKLSGVCYGMGDPLDVSFGTAVGVTTVDLHASGVDTFEDLFSTPHSEVVTIAGFAASELALLKLERDGGHADDTYEQVVGVISVVVKYSRVLVDAS